MSRDVGPQPELVPVCAAGNFSINHLACTSAFAWLLTRLAVEPVYRPILIPRLGLFGMLFGLWYVGL